MRFLLDTNVISEMGRAHPHPKVFTWMLQHEVDSGVPAIALAERYQGAMLAEAERRLKLLADVDHFVGTQPERIIPFDAAAARAWGEYVAAEEFRLKPTSYPDSQIAATALAHGLTVVTRNTEHFPRVPTLNPFED